MMSAVTQRLGTAGAAGAAGAAGSPFPLRGPATNISPDLVERFRAMACEVTFQVVEPWKSTPVDSSTPGPSRWKLWSGVMSLTSTR